MKKMVLLLYFMIGSSLVILTLSLFGCERKEYRFIYKIGHTTFWQKNNYQTELKDSCAFADFVISQQLDYEILTAANFSFSANNLYAFKPAEPTYTPVEKLTDFKIYTINNYNANYPSGSEISAICKFYTMSDDYNNSDNDSSKAWILEKLNSVLYGYGNGRFVAVHLTEPPSAQAEQQFEIEVRTENNEMMRSQSEVIIIKP